MQEFILCVFLRKTEKTRDILKLMSGSVLSTLFIDMYCYLYSTFNVRDIIVQYSQCTPFLFHKFEYNTARH